MTEDDKKYDDPEMEKFFTEHRDMIERILAQERERAAAAAADVRREAESRAAYERELARSRLQEGGERAGDAYRDSRNRAENAFNDGRDHFRQFADEQADYAYDAARAERERARRVAAEEERARVRAEAARQKDHVDEATGKVLSVMTDPQFQQHLMGAGMEMFMAASALLRASPVPDSVKQAADRADRNKNTEYCRKNPYCQKKTPSQRQRTAGETGVRKIEVVAKDTKTDTADTAKKV